MPIFQPSKYGIDDDGPARQYSCGCWDDQADHTCMGGQRPADCHCGAPDDCYCHEGDY